MKNNQSAVIMPDTSARFGFLHVHRFLFRTGLSIANTFAWIFVFQYFTAITRTITDALIATLAMYIIGQAVTILLTPISASHVRRGTKHSLVFGSLIAGAAYISLGATLYGTLNGEPIGWGIAVFAILLGAYRAVYWVPYQLRASTKSHGRSRLPIVYEVLIALMPAFAGITMAVVPYAPLRLLFGSAVLIGMSLVPVMALKDFFERFSWSYAETFRQLFKRSNRRLLAASVGGGLQGTALFLVWPIAVFFIVGSSYKTLGAILSASFLLILLLRYAYCKMSLRPIGWVSDFTKSPVDGMRFERSVPVGIAFSVSGWLIRLFVGSPVGVILADSYSHISAPRSSHSIDALTAEQYADNGSFIDEYTTLKEMGLAIGRIGACVILGFLLLWTTLPIAFAMMIILAGIASAVSVVMERPVVAGF